MSDHPISVPSEKQCRRCGLILPASQFRKHTGVHGNKDGLHSFCRPCCRKVTTEHYHADLDTERQKRRDWSKENLHKVSRKNKKWRVRLRLEVIQGYGGKCACCGEDRLEFLCIDHINGGGRKELREKFNNRSYTFFNWLKKNNFPAQDYRVLCHNCNMARGLYGYCPHEREREACGFTYQI